MKRLAILLLTGFCLPVAAQTHYNDAQLWAGLYVEKRLNDGFRLHFKHQSRLTQNMSWYDRAYLAAGVSYRFTGWFRIRTDYAFVQKRLNEGAFSTRHQLRASLIFKHDVARWRFVYRNMSQFRFKDPLTTKDGFSPSYFNRSKVMVKYEATKRFTFYVAGELFVPLYNWQPKSPDRVRSSAGTYINLTEKHQLQLFFMLQNQLQKKDWYDGESSASDMLVNKYVYGITYGIYF
jgi:hypothetical protein